MVLQGRAENRPRLRQRTKTCGKEEDEEEMEEKSCVGLAGWQAVRTSCYYITLHHIIVFKLVFFIKLTLIRCFHYYLFFNF